MHTQNSSFYCFCRKPHGISCLINLVRLLLHNICCVHKKEKGLSIKMNIKSSQLHTSISIQCNIHIKLKKFPLNLAIENNFGACTKMMHVHNKTYMGISCTVYLKTYPKQEPIKFPIFDNSIFQRDLSLMTYIFMLQYNKVYWCHDATLFTFTKLNFTNTMFAYKYP